MNVAKPCPDRFEDIVAFVMGELDPAAARELQEHIALCDTCRAARDVLVAEEKEVRAGFAALARGLGPIEQAVLHERERQTQVRVGASDNHFLERVKAMILTHKRLSVAAAAVTAMALAAGLLLYVSLFSSSTAAYALEQTVQANHHVTTYHVKITPAAAATHDVTSGLSEAWVQVGPDGAPLRARMDCPKSEDGDKVVIVSANKIEVWGKDKNMHIFLPEKDALRMVKKMRYVADPKLLFEELQAKQKAGKVQVATKEPAKPGEPITLTVTSKDAPDRRQVCEVDPKTKLVQRVTTYCRHGDHWKQVELREFLDYNKEIDPKIFQLDLPKDVTTLDQIHDKPGLVKGNLTDDEMARKVVREFFEALIAEDYTKAGLIFEGTPAEKMKQIFGRFKFFRVIDVGTPVAGQHPDKKALQVPVKVEWEIKDSKVVKPFSPTVRLTDAEKATKAVRQFYEAVIKQDGAAAYRIMQETGFVQEGLTAEEVKKMKETLAHEHVRFLRIVEMGTPVPHPESKTMEVPLKIELEATPGKSVRQFTPFVRAPHGQPDRRVICGGI